MWIIYKVRPAAVPAAILMARYFPLDALAFIPIDSYNEFVGIYQFQAVAEPTTLIASKFCAMHINAKKQHKRKRVNTMNITFFIGNGFDINLGLKTQYKDFYPFYLSKGHHDLLSDAISNDFSNWADLELGLGMYLEQVEPEDFPAFLACKATLEKDLVEYLARESNRLSFPSPNIMTEFQKRVTEFYRDFSSQAQSDYLEWQYSVRKSILYQFVSFNYTSSLDQILQQARKLKEFGTHNTPQNYIFIDKIANLIHIHGTLEDELILGINDPSQIGNLDMREINEVSDYIIKSSINELLGNRRTQKVKQIVDDSAYICIYGMSLGDTDLLWWEYIFKWLVKDPSHRLVLYIYDELPVPSGPVKLQRMRYWQDVFLKKVNAPGPAASTAKSRIIVLIKSKIFNFENIRLEEVPNGQT